MKTMFRILFTTLALAYAVAAAGWTSKDERACDNNTAGKFKYYVLSLSWSPEFCRSHPGNKEPQCKQNRAFIVHGLWPECGTGNPQRCEGGGSADAIDKEKIHAFMPSEFLIQHEWDSHGTCSGLDRSVYFDLTGSAVRQTEFPASFGCAQGGQDRSAVYGNQPRTRRR